jgi:hypothetical protein
MAREMNKIEQIFYDAYETVIDEYTNDGKYDNANIDFAIMAGLYPQFVIGIYVADFVMGDCAIEIDGHDAHKTKEQREHDYKRERYLLRNGYIPVRFTGTEVFLQPRKCILEAAEIAYKQESGLIEQWQNGVEFGRTEKSNEHKDRN